MVEDPFEEVLENLGEFLAVHVLEFEVGLDGVGFLDNFGEVFEFAFGVVALDSEDLDFIFKLVSILIFFMNEIDKLLNFFLLLLGVLIQRLHFV